MTNNATWINLKANTTYYFASNPPSGITVGSTTFRMDLRIDGSTIVAREADGGGGTYTPTEDTTVRVGIRVAPSYAIPSNCLIYPVTPKPRSMELLGEGDGEDVGEGEVGVVITNTLVPMETSSPGLSGFVSPSIFSPFKNVPLALARSVIVNAPSEETSIMQ